MSVLAGGCSSPVRSGWQVGGEPFIQSRGDGAYAYDEQGNRYIDYIMGYGPLLFGYNHPALTTGLDEIAKNGVLFGSTHMEEVRLAERIRSHMPHMERIRFVTTGTEAVMSAVRVARAFTGRDLILKFAGNYHGHFDAALFQAGASASVHNGSRNNGLSGSGTATSRSGIPENTMRDVLVARYNDLDSVDALLKEKSVCHPEPVEGRHSACVGDRLAAIIVEPICANMGLVMPEPGFLDGLRSRCDRYGALLIFDEVITWLRLGLGGALPHCVILSLSKGDTLPDITTIGKILGGGIPIAAFGGRADVMAVLAPEGSVFTGGTHAGYPFGIAMAHRVLDALEQHSEYYGQMNGLAQRLADEIREKFRRYGLPYSVTHLESIVDFKFRVGRANRSYDDAISADRDKYGKYHRAMAARGILLPPSQNEVMFFSTAHSSADVGETIEAIRESLPDA